MGLSESVTNASRVTEAISKVRRLVNEARSDIVFHDLGTWERNGWQGTHQKALPQVASCFTTLAGYRELQRLDVQGQDSKLTGTITQMTEFCRS